MFDFSEVSRGVLTSSKPCLVSKLGALRERTNVIFTIDLHNLKLQFIDTKKDNRPIRMK